MKKVYIQVVARESVSIEVPDDYNVDELFLDDEMVNKIWDKIDNLNNSADWLIDENCEIEVA